MVCSLRIRSILIRCRILELIKGQDEEYHILAHWNDLPVFLYDETVRTAESTRWDGLLRGHVLVRVRGYFFFGSTTYCKQAVRAIFFGSGIENSRKGRNPVANIHQMKKITPECLAYAATQV